MTRWLLVLVGTTLPSVAFAVDKDGDGYPAVKDCNDSDPTVYPGAPEIAGDGIDQDCDGVDAVGGSGSTITVTGGTGATYAYDADGDGWIIDKGDCDDNDASVYPGAPEVADGV